MALREYAIGQAVRLTFRVLEEGVPVDPATLVVRVANPALTETDYTLAGAAVIKDADGLYHVDVVPDTAGTWTYAGRTTSPVATTPNRTFTVIATVFD